MKDYRYQMIKLHLLPVAKQPAASRQNEGGQEARGGTAGNGPALVKVLKGRMHPKRSS